MHVLASTTYQGGLERGPAPATNHPIHALRGGEIPCQMTTVPAMLATPAPHPTLPSFALR